MTNEVMNKEVSKNGPCNIKKKKNPYFRCQKLFHDFLDEWSDAGDSGDPKYLPAARELAKPERNTLVVSMKDVERHNVTLANHITDEYYRVYPYLCNALKNYVHDRAEVSMQAKDYYVSLIDIDAGHRLRALRDPIQETFFGLSLSF